MRFIKNKFKTSINFSRTTIFKIATFFLLIITITTIVLCTFIYSRSYRFIENENKIYVENLCKTTSDNVDYIIERADRVTRMLLGYVDVQRILNNSQQTGYTEMDYLSDMGKITYLTVTLIQSGDNLIVNFYDKRGQILFYDRNFINRTPTDLNKLNWFTESSTKISKREVFLISPKDVDIILTENIRPIVIIKPLTSFDGREIISYITTYVDTNNINYLFKRSLQVANDKKEARYETIIELTDKNDNIIASSDTQSIGQKQKKTDKGYAYVHYTSQYTGYTVTIKVCTSYLIIGLSAFTKQTTILFITTIVVSFVIIVFLLFYKLRPFFYLLNSMRHVKNGNFDVELNEDNLDYDVKVLYNGFNSMVKEIKYLITHEYENKLMLKSAQLEVLKYQINPHFLYNTLQTMESIGEVNDVPEIQKISKCLGKMFRYNLHGTNIVCLRDEIDHIKTYLIIERIRFEEKIHCSILIDEEYLDIKVLKFVLQPIIENTIIHGFKNLDRKGIIVIDSEIINENIVLYIEDNGKGMSDSQLGEINMKMEEAKSINYFSNNPSIGIVNVQRRIVNYFGQSYGLVYESNKGYGTKVIITMPLIK